MIAIAETIRSGERTSRPRPEARMSTDRLMRAHRAREAQRRQAHDRHALDVLDRRVRGEQLVVRRHDRHVDVGPAHGAQQAERLVVGRLGVGDHDPVDLLLVDDARQLGDGTQPALARRPVVDEADELEPVLGVRLDLALDQVADGAGADDHGAAGPHDRGQGPRAQRAAERRDQHQRDPEHHQRLERRVDRQVEALADALADHEQHERAREQRVEDLAHLVEAVRRDRPRLALVEAVRGEQEDPADGAGRPQRGEQPVRRDERRRADLLGQQVHAQVRDLDRDQVGDHQEPDAPAHQPTRTVLDGRPRGLRHAAARQSLRVGGQGRERGSTVTTPAAHAGSRDRGRTRIGSPRCGWSRRACDRCWTGGT